MIVFRAVFFLVLNDKISYEKGSQPNLHSAHDDRFPSKFVWKVLV